MPSQRDTSHIDVRYVAALARLELSDDEIERYGVELNAVLDYMNTLRELDLDDIEPMAHAARRQNVLREDTPGACLDPPLIIDNAPESADDCFIKVPPVIEDEEGA